MPTVAELTNELFAEIERSQGFAFVSDGETFPTVEQFFERQRGRMMHAEEAVRVFKKFLRKYKQL